MVDKTSKVLKQLKHQRVEPKNPINGQFYLPNHSGDLSAGTANSSPVNANSIVNKAYVDNSIADLGAAGNNKEIQFNDNGNFGADSGLAWDNTNKRLGIGTTAPLSSLTVLGDGTTPIFKVYGTSTHVASADFTHTIEAVSGTQRGIRMKPSIKSNGGSMQVLNNNVNIYGSSNIGAISGQLILPTFLSNWTGAASSFTGLAVQGGSNAGTGTLSTYIGSSISDCSYATTSRGYQSTINSGTNKHNLYLSGTADNYLNGNLGLGTATPTEALEIKQGNLLFSGANGKGLAAGSMYNDNTNTTVTISTIGTMVRVPSGFTQGHINNCSFANSREITITKAGKYKIDWSLSFEVSSGTNQDAEGAIMINNVRNVQGTAHRKIGAAADLGNMGATCILDLAVNDVVSLGLQNNTSTSNFVVNHGNMALVMVGS